MGSKYTVVMKKSIKEMETEMLKYDVHQLGSFYVSQGTNRVYQSFIGEFSEQYKEHLEKVLRWASVQGKNEGDDWDAVDTPDNIPSKKAVPKAEPKKATKGRGKRVTKTDDGSVVEGFIPDDMK